MLDYLQIKNFTIIENESVELHSGLNIITGESGAGKSLILDAIYLILGSRASTDIIRPESDKCELSAQFNITHNNDAKAWLKKADIDDSECIITRKFHRNKPGKCYLNGEIITQKQLKEFASILVYIHSQNENYKVCEPSYQLTLLDNYAENHELTAKVAGSHHRLVALKKELDELTDLVSTQEDKLAMLDYHLNELYEHTQGDEPFEVLERNYKRISASISYQERLQETSYFISGKGTLNDLITLRTKLEAHQDNFPEITNTTEILQEAITNLEEAQQELKTNLNSIDISDEQGLEDKINKYHELARKHNTTAIQLPGAITSLEQKRQLLLSAADKLTTKTKEYNEKLQSYNQYAEKLHEARQKAAIKLAAEIKAMLPKLGMKHATVKITSTLKDELQRATGKDEVCFLFSANLGHQLEKLQDIASGGEIARVSMILELLTNKQRHNISLIFDEVDTGVSGKIARDIGMLLKKLSATSQVIAITHLPQVASLADHNYKITKVTEGKKTYSKITHLSESQKIDEIASLISDGSINDSATLQARVLCGEEC